MSFITKVKKHMGNYKRQVLNITVNGIWRDKRQPNGYVEREHILPKEKIKNVHKKNLLKTYRDECWAYILREKIKLHPYAHHLNSSQMMCINFFYPFAVKDEIKKHLISVIQNHCFEQVIINNPENLKFEFEYESPKDKIKHHRATNFDLRISNNNLKLYFEIKYTENAFGKCRDKKDERYITKYNEKYHDLAEKVIDSKLVSNDDFYDIFYDNYQIMRNLVHIGKDRYVVFLYHDQNERIATQATEAKKFLKEEYQNKLICLTWDDLYNETEKELKSVFAADKNLSVHFEEFSEKYLKFN
jgi:hypothetical protein